jgi:hypothetical protein
VHGGFDFLPGKRVIGLGDTWTKLTVNDAGSLGRYKYTAEYALDGKPGPSTKMKVQQVGMEYERPGDHANNNPLPFAVTAVNLEVTKSGGSLLFDARKGRLESSELLVEMGGEVTIDVGGQKTTVRLNQTQNTTVKTMDALPNKK